MAAASESGRILGAIQDGHYVPNGRTLEDVKGFYSYSASGWENF